YPNPCPSPLSKPRLTSQSLCWRLVVVAPAQLTCPRGGQFMTRCWVPADKSPADFLFIQATTDGSESGREDVATRCLSLVLGQAQILSTLVPLHFPSQCLRPSGPTPSPLICTKRG